MSSVELRRTSEACPEAYDAYVDGQYLGHLRLRHGIFRAQDKNGLTAYIAEIGKRGPTGTGGFSDIERSYHLPKAQHALLLAKAGLTNGDTRVRVIRAIEEELGSWSEALDIYTKLKSKGLLVD